MTGGQVDVDPRHLEQLERDIDAAIEARDYRRGEILQDVKHELLANPDMCLTSLELDGWKRTGYLT